MKKLIAATSFKEHVISIIVISAIGLVGYFKGLDILEKLENIGLGVTLLIVGALFVGFGAFDVKAAAAGIEWPKMPSRSWWEILTIVGGTLIVVQGFETSRYLGAEYDEATRIKSCRLSQIVSTVVFVAFILTLLVIFLPPAGETDGTAIFRASNLVGDSMPWLLLLAAVGSQTSAIIGATSSRSDMLVSRKVPRKYTFPIILAPAILLVLLVDVNVAVNLASRVFAAYFIVQAALAGLLASRKQHWTALAGFLAIGLAMAAVLIFGLPL